MIQDPRILTRIARFIGVKGTSPGIPALPLLGAIVNVPISESPEEAEEVLVLPNPALGGIATVQVAGGEAIRLLAAHFRYVASGIAANRFMLIDAVLTGSTTAFIWRTLHSTAHTAGITADYSAAVGTGIASSNLDRVFPLPYEAIIPPGYTLSIYAREIDGGDQISRVRLLIKRLTRND